MAFGTRVGKYELGRSLGEGTFAKVKVARNVVTGERFAVKIIDKGTIFKNNLVCQVKREITTMKFVRHPNIVRLYEVLASKRRVYLVMEYVTGGELSDRIDKLEKLSEDEARKYFQQLINAIDYCHSRNVFHRDLKPQNLLLDKNGNLKISDFGLSVLLKKNTVLSTTCGSPDYAAPEVIMGLNYNGAAADIWSCGVILFEMLAGYSPFDATSLSNQYQKICKAEITFPSWISDEAKNLIEKILNPKPEDRITISQIYEDDWFRKDYVASENTWDGEDIEFDDVLTAFDGTEVHPDTKTMKPVFINAFELIAMANDLSGLFDKNAFEQKRRFVSNVSAEETINKTVVAMRALGLSAERVRACKVRISKNRGRRCLLSFSVEVIEVAPSLSVVEVFKSGGGEMEYTEAVKCLSSILTNNSHKVQIAMIDEARMKMDDDILSCSSEEINPVGA